VTSILVYLFRFAVIILGYAVAALAASAFLNLLSIGAVDWRPDEMPWVAGSVLFTIPVVALVVGYFAFIPAVPAILLAEVLGKRDWLFYAIAGAMVAAVVVGFLWQSSWPLPDNAYPGQGLAPVHPAVGDAGFVLMVIGSGIVGGVAYWLTAGRWAGGWRNSPAPPISTGRSVS
jgi:hypothetical protein